MKLEKNSNSMLFSSTEIPDVFFTEYMSQANGDFIKVYLCLLFLSKYDKDINLNDLSKKLDIPLQKIKESLVYWEAQGVLTKKVDGYILNNLQEVELHKLYSPNLTLSAEDVKKNSDNKYRAQALECINNMYLQGIMCPAWYSDIDLWFKKYGFDEQVMIQLFQYCFSKSALHKNYVQTVAEAWGSNKIQTWEDLDSYYQKQDALVKIKKTIAKNNNGT